MVSLAFCERRQVSGRSDAVVDSALGAQNLTNPTLALSPQGNLRLEESVETSEFEGELETPTHERIVAAFGRGQGHGLLHLGAESETSVLPAAFAFWRDFGRLFMTGLCSLPDLEETRGTFTVSVSRDELARRIETVPPMRGGEYLSTEVLEHLWSELEVACRAKLADSDGTVSEFLQSKNPIWDLVGRVHFHLAERKGNATTPFAFLATYTTRPGNHGAVKHLPLGKALEISSDRGTSTLLVSLLRPVQAAAERSPFLKELVGAGSLFHPLAWTSAKAYRFLKDVPAYEEGGVVVKIPDWWKARGTRRPQVQVTIGGKNPSGLGLYAMLDFSLDVVLDGERLTKKERAAILAATDGLALIRGRWVEVDREKLQEVLAHWESVQEATGGSVTFAAGMRLLAGVGIDDGDALASNVEEWSTRVTGAWLKEALESWRDSQPDDDGDLTAVLRPYQKAGVS